MAPSGFSLLAPSLFVQKLVIRKAPEPKKQLPHHADKIGGRGNRHHAECCAPKHLPALGYNLYAPASRKHVPLERKAAPPAIPAAGYGKAQLVGSNPFSAFFVFVHPAMKDFRFKVCGRKYRAVCVHGHIASPMEYSGPISSRKHNTRQFFVRYRVSAVGAHNRVVHAEFFKGKRYGRQYVSKIQRIKSRINAKDACKKYAPMRAQVPGRGKPKYADH